LQASVGAQIDVRGSEHARAEDPTAAIETVSIVLFGCVVDADGTPREGAVVVSSAGGRALTDARGDYRLEVEVPLDATSVQVTAVAGGGGGSLVASASVAITGSSTTPSGTLLLERSGCCQPSWVPTFGEQPGVGGDASALTVFDDGSGPALYVGGNFSTAGGVAANCIAKWDGSSWAALGSGVNSYVDALTVFDDGSGPALYAGGGFLSAGGVAANCIAKWDGSN